MKSATKSNIQCSTFLHVAMGCSVKMLWTSIKPCVHVCSVWSILYACSETSRLAVSVCHDFSTLCTCGRANGLVDWPIDMKRDFLLNLSHFGLLLNSCIKPLILIILRNYWKPSFGSNSNCLYWCLPS